MKIDLVDNVVRTLEQFLSKDANQELPTNLRTRAPETNAPALGFKSRDLLEVAQLILQQMQQRSATDLAKRVADEKEILQALVGLLEADEFAPKNKDKKMRKVDAWSALRASIRKMGHSFGVALDEIYRVVSETGMGYRPSLPELRSDVERFWQQIGNRSQSQSEDELAATIANYMKEKQFEEWQVALMRQWMRVKGLTPAMVSEEQLENFFFDDEVIRALTADSPWSWDVHQAQARSQRAHRSLGHSLEEVAK